MAYSTGKLPFDEVNRICREQHIHKQWIPGGKNTGKDYVVCNPTRDDRNPGSFRVSQDGKWVDHATDDRGGDHVSLYAYINRLEQGEACKELAGSLGIPINGKLPPKAYPKLPLPPEAHYKMGKPSYRWTYRDKAGAILHYVDRFETPDGKEIRPLSYDGKEWQWKGYPTPRPLYNLHRIATTPHATIVLCEGEKTADAAAKLFPSCITTTISGGCNAIDKTDYTPLKGHTVHIWPDHDDSGREFAGKLRNKLKEVGARVQILKVPPDDGQSFPKGWDAADAVEEGWTPERVAALEFEPEPFDGFFTMDELRFTKFLEAQPKPIEWIIQDVMPVGKTGLLVAPGGSGKGYLLVQLAISVAAGVPLFGRYPIDKPGGVLAFFAEDDEEELHRRFTNAVNTVCDAPEIDSNQFKLDLEKNLFVASMIGRDDLAIIESTPAGPIRTASFNRFMATAAQIPDLRLLIFDPTRHFMGGDENSSLDSTRYVQALQALSQATGTFVLAVQHTNKFSMRSGDAMGQEAARGSSALTDAVRWQMNIATMDKQTAKKYGIRKDEDRMQHVQVSIPKNNYAPPFGQIWLRRGVGGFLHYTEIKPTDELENEQILESAIQIITERAQAGDEYSKRRFCERFSGKAGELKCGRDRLLAIIEMGIDRGSISERPPREKRRGLLRVLCTE